jgi:methylmalonyl-CoA mutase
MKPASTPAELAEQFANGLTLGDCLATPASATTALAGGPGTHQAGGKAVFTVERLIPYRAAEGFEELRLRTERHSRKSGRPPRVLLLAYGDLKMRKARADFSQSFFSTAGFETVTEFAGSDADAAVKLIAERDPDLVVLCSADQEYTAIAGPLVAKLRAISPTLKRASPIPVIVAGYPEAAVEQLRRDGVADFIHIRSNAVEVLRHWQQQLGIPPQQSKNRIAGGPGMGD